MKAKAIVFILLAMLLALGVTPVYADGAPVLPHAFYGTVEVNGSPVPVGTQVEARGDGVETGIGNNPIEVTVAGEYGGGANPLEPKLIVQGDIAEGATLTFYVNGVSTDQTAEWHSGGVSELNIDATIEGSLPPPPATTEPPPATTEPPPATTEPPPATTEPPPATTEPPPESDDSTPPPESSEPAPGEPDSSASPTPPLPPSSPSDSGSGEWPVLWWVIGGVVVVGLIIFAVARRRAY